MSEIIESVEVDVPVTAAYAQWTRFEEFPAFMEGVDKVVRSGDGHMVWTIEIGGQKREFEAVVTEQVPGERVAWKTTDGTTHAGVVTFHRLSDTSSKITLQLKTVPEGVVEQLGDKLGLVSARAKGDMKRFKAFVESSGTTTTA
ncbi:cyclase [Nocardiopsis sp. TSRI0078]|uniref:SRPBCC family protein n=1 Tax=unclassified Nocardiopsis TaxID=2649073 RepID=UPI00093BFDE4|nr:SRPBCC family protein [Nocardiopsis sp. TSRI0078]OKI17204.1 cyclase [Nocardiopsis sp. TSRI0078]